jgi:peptidoglycan/xylan/chitin deacetylase (PgdA/CDA1 family)
MATVRVVSEAILVRRALIAVMLWLVSAAALAETQVAALAYHDIVAVKNGDPFAITTDEFRRQLDYLVGAGYHPISLATLERVHGGEAELPSKPVLLTFDDGYKSYYDIAFPLLRQYGFPSVISLVTSWIDGRSTPDYTSARFMTWDELRTIARSPLVEVLSHSDDLHRNVVGNAFGARLPSAETRLYDPKTKSYESEDAHNERVRADLSRSIKRIKDELGVAPRGITWPYGRYDGPALGVASAVGLRIYLTLDEQPTLPAEWPRVNRGTFKTYRKLADLGELLTFEEYRKRQWRFVTVDLSEFADKQPEELAQLIFQLGQRIELLRVNTVILRPFTSDAKRAFFHTDAMPVAADVLSQIAFQLTERAGIRDLMVQVPADINPKACIDLARLNWFSSAVVEGDPSGTDFQRTMKVLRRFKPTLKLGTTEASVDSNTSVDFRLIELPAALSRAEIEERVKAVLKSGPRALFKLDRSHSVSIESLGATMTVLREAGAMHYGYGPDGFLNNDPEFLRIVRPLSEYTIPPARR